MSPYSSSQVRNGEDPVAVFLCLPRGRGQCLFTPPYGQPHLMCVPSCLDPVQQHYSDPSVSSGLYACLGVPLQEMVKWKR